MEYRPLVLELQRDLATISPSSSTTRISAMGTSSRISGSMARQCSSGRNVRVQRYRGFGLSPIVGVTGHATKPPKGAPLLLDVSALACNNAARQ